MVAVEEKEEAEKADEGATTSTTSDSRVKLNTDGTGSNLAIVAERLVDARLSASSITIVRIASSRVAIFNKSCLSVVFYSCS